MLKKWQFFEHLKPPFATILCVAIIVFFVVYCVGIFYIKDMI